MTINLKLHNGIGHLALNVDKSPAAAELDGWIDFIVDPKNDHVRARLNLKAWIKRGLESAPWFALSGLGRTGALHKQSDESEGDSPHYVGHLGPELRVFGWSSIDGDGEPYMTLKVVESAESSETKSPGDDDAVDIDPDLKSIFR